MSAARRARRAVLSPALRRALARIARNRTRGARELVYAAARAIARDPGPSGRRSAREQEAWVRELAAQLLEVQPGMAPFYHLANALLRAAEHEPGLGGPVATAAREAAWRFLEEAEAYAEEAAERTVRLLPDGATIATYSRSSTVLEAFRRAADAGLRYVVRVSESRPRGEGRSVARAALDLGHRVEFFTDAALHTVLEGAAALLVGADAIGETRFRNKVGTHALARSARDAGVPIYLVGDPLKFLPERFWLPEPRQPAREVWALRRVQLQVKNPIFEEVPLARVDGVILGTGTGDPHPPDELTRWPSAGYFQPIERLLAGL